MELSMNLRQAIKAYKSGNEASFSSLYEESCKYIYTCVYKVMSGNNNAQDIIDDIMQDTYVEISKSIWQLEDEERFLSWAGTIATRKCYAYLKKNAKYVLLNEEDKTFENLQESDAFIPESVSQDKEKQRLIREIINTQLSEMQKLCIIAYYYNEQKQSEIAEELGIPENTVKTNLSRAKAKIKDAVLDLEKNKDTKLYSVAPLFVFLFTEEVQAAVVPARIGAKVFSAVGVSASATATATATATSFAGKIGIGAKLAAISVKAKVIAVVAAVSVFGVAGGIANAITKNEQSSQPSQVNNIDQAYKSLILDGGDAFGYALYDLDKDSMPELFVSRENNVISAYSLDENTVHTIQEYNVEGIKQTDNEVSARIYAFHSTDGNLWYVDLRVFRNEYNFINGEIKLVPTVLKDGTLHPGEHQIYVGDWAELSDSLSSLYQINFNEIQESELETQIREIRNTRNYEKYLGKALVDIYHEMVDMFEENEKDTPAEEQTQPEETPQNSENEEPKGNETATIKQILLHPEIFTGYYPDNVVETGLMFAVVDINKDGINEVFIGDSMTSFVYQPLRIFNVLYEKDGAVYDVDGDHIYDDDLILGFTVYENGILKNGGNFGNGPINLWNIYTGESWTSNGSDGVCESVCEGEEIQFKWYVVTEENIALYLEGDGIVHPYGTYKSTGGTMLDFAKDVVFVTEGNATTKCTYTLDKEGKLTIISGSEVIEGSYDAQTDVVTLLGRDYKK